jgi:uracil-DNA glycosylase family 4
MIQFESHPTCQDCPLHEAATHPGLPTRTLRTDETVIASTMAVLFVGQSPGFNEDRQGMSFVGWTGKLLERFIEAAGLQEICDIYLANSCRCKPPQGADERQSNIRACRKYLAEDVALLQEQYDEVIIMALGAKACYSTLNLSSLNAALKKQGMESPVLGTEGNRPRVFSTYHPAILHPSREPQKVHAVETHFSLLDRYIVGDFIPNDLKVTPEIGIDPPVRLPKKVSVDIETYGILSGVEQTVFHPIKSLHVDGISLKKQIITVSFAWRFGDGPVRTALYMMHVRRHRQLVALWFRRMAQQNSRVTCIGQNLKFDLLYLYYSGDPELPYWIDPRRLVVDDTLLMSFLLYEQQPEKGLKELSTLFGIADYSGSRVTGKAGNAKSPTDPDLHYYNCLDAAATLVLYEELERRIRDRYGEGSSKLGKVSAWTRNAVLWDTFELERAGSALSVSKLREYHEEEDRRCKEIFAEAEDKYDIKLAGAGSDKPLRRLMLKCLKEAKLLDDSRVIWTGKTKKISIGVENVNLVKEEIPNGRNKDVICLFQEYKERSKIVNTYTGPLLNEPSRGIVVTSGDVGLVYPSWYPIPMYADRGGDRDDKAGGQIQGRFSCKKPARQTEPGSIRRCSCSRWAGGKIVEYDVNQDHLRMAALLSGDPILMSAYETPNSPSLHKMTAQTLFPEKEIVKGSDEYKLGKTINFLVLFRGGASAFQATALRDCGIELDIGFCERAIKTWYAKHLVYGLWQDEQIALAGRQGYSVLPTGWSRTFVLGSKNIEAQAGEVCNFLHQTPCAQVLHSAQYKAIRAMREANLRSVVCLQIHDALFADVYPGEDRAVHEIMDDAMIHPPLLEVFYNWVMREVPWAYENKIDGETVVWNPSIGTWEKEG